MAAELKADIYFANPYHSCERGLNENSNGLLRQYFPKSMELADITEEQAQGGGRAYQPPTAKSTWI